MRAKRTPRVLVLLMTVSLLPTMVQATHEPQSKDVVTVATGDPWFMSCTPVSGQQICTIPSERIINHRANVLPDDGPLQSVFTRVNGTVNGGYYMFAMDQQWNADLHGVGCNNPTGIGAFMAELGKDSPGPKTVGPTVIGECSITGKLFVPVDQAPYYEVNSTTLPSAFPTPTPSPTPVPTAAPPTATPSPTPTLRPATPTPRPTATATATAASSDSASTSASASASESALASQSESVTASGSAEQTVAGITFSPEPSVPVGAPYGGVGGWPGSVPGTGGISSEPTDVAGSALAALLLLAVMGFIGELFNNTMETHYDRIIGWWKESWLGRIGRGLSAMLGGGAK